MVTHSKTILLLKILILLAVLGGCIGNNRATPVKLPLPIGEFPAKFTRQLDFDTTVVSRPTIGNDFFLIHTETSLYKYKVNGVKEWQIKYPGYKGVHPPVIINDLVVVPTDIGQFVVVSVDDGALKWSGKDQDDFELGHDIEDIAFSEGIVVIAKFNSQVTAYNVQNGQILWTHDITQRTSPYLVIKNSIVYMAASGFLTAYDLITGRELWNIDFDTFVGPMIESENKLILVLGPPAKTEVAVIDLSSRNILWRKYVKGFLSTAYGGIVLDSQSVYLTGNKVIALSVATGEILWESQESEKSEELGKPIILGDNIYVRDYDSTVYALNIKDGSIIGRLHIGKDQDFYNFDRGPAGLDGVLIVPFGDNRVFIYEP
jgi:outer membrane protein assembly factor BamB